MTYQVLISAVTGIGLAACATFVIRYWWRTGGRWMRDEAGWFMMAYWATLGVLFGLVLSNQWLGDWPGRRPVTVVVFVAFVATTWWPNRLLSIAQKRRRER